MKRFTELVARIEKVEQRLEQSDGSFDSADSIPKRNTITFSVNRQWSADDLLRFCQAVRTLYGIFLVQSESADDEDCARLLLEWDKSIDIVLSYRKANDADCTDGHLCIETVNLHPQGLISLRGWPAPIERLRKVVGKASRRTSVKRQTKVAKRSVARTKLLSGVARRRLVAIVLSCLTDLETLGAVVC